MKGVKHQEQKQLCPEQGASLGAVLHPMTLEHFRPTGRGCRFCCIFRSLLKLVSSRASWSSLDELRAKTHTPIASLPRAKQTSSHFWLIPKPPPFLPSLLFLSISASSSNAQGVGRNFCSPDSTHPGPVHGRHSQVPQQPWGGSSSAVSRWAQRAQRAQWPQAPVPAQLWIFNNAQTVSPQYHHLFTLLQLPHAVYLWGWELQSKF